MPPSDPAILIVVGRDATASTDLELDTMDIRVVEEAGRTAMEVTILCAPADPRVTRVVRRLRSLGGGLVGYEPGGGIERRLVAADEVLSIETSEGRAYLHLADGPNLESPLRLFELEDLLAGTEFVRASRQELVNLGHVRSIRPEVGGRLVLVLDDGSSVLASRSYAREIKARIGITSR